MRTHTHAGEALPGNLDVNLCQPLQRTGAPKTASEKMGYTRDYNRANDDNPLEFWVPHFQNNIE